MFNFFYFSGTTSSSNTMVPGNDGHHDSKIKDSNMEDRYDILKMLFLGH